MPTHELLMMMFMLWINFSKRALWARHVGARLLIPALRRQRQADFWVWGQPGLQSKVQDSQGYKEKPCLKTNKQTNKQNKNQNLLKSRTKIYLAKSLGEKKNPSLWTYEHGLPHDKNDWVWMACEYHEAKEREDERNGQNVDERVLTGFPDGRCRVIHKNPKNQTSEGRET